MRTPLMILAACVLLTACAADAPPPPAAAPEAPAKPAVPPPPTPAPAPAVAEAATSGDADTSVDGDPVAGEKHYGTFCVACHQADGTGMGGVLGADFVNDKSRLAKSNDVLLKSIADGVPGTAMAPWSAALDEQARKDVLAYLRTNFGG